MHLDPAPIDLADLPERFTALRLLHRGSASEVWLARDRERSQEVALKLAAREHPRAAGALLHESKLLKALRHPHIVRLLDVGESSGLDWLALEPLTGGSLEQLRGQPVGTIVSTASKLVEALRFAHGRGMVHRDLKPSNVLLDASGSLRLCDWGVARRLGEPGAEGRFGGGSPKAASPQQVAGASATVADDVYGLGALLYELIGGTAPLGPRPSAETIARRVPEPLGRLAPLAPEPLCTLVDRMLAKQPDARPKDMNDVQLALRALVQGSERRSRATESTGPTGDVAARGPRTSGEQGTGRWRGEGQPQPARTSRIGPGGSQPEFRDPNRALLERVLWIGATLLFLGGVGFFAWLPRRFGPVVAPVASNDGSTTARARIEDSHTPGSAAFGTPDAATVNSASALDPERAAIERAASQAVLGELVELQDDLRDRGAELWGSRDWALADDDVARGDAHYQARDYATAKATYSDALDRLKALRQRQPEVLATALGAGEEALTGGDRDEAVRQFDLALRIAPDSEPAADGRARADKLDDVLERVRGALAEEERQAWRSALREYRAALEIDARFDPARKGAKRVRERLVQIDFQRLIAGGFDALARGELNAAQERFERAQRLRPSASEPRDGLTLVRERADQSEIERLRDRATASERAENWTEAAELYARALTLDPELAFASTGLERSRTRAELDRKIAGFIDEPARLFSAQARKESRKLIRAVGTLDPGPKALRARAARLAELIQIAATPVPVVFESDNLTEVVLYRVGKLGQFQVQQLELEPGRYTIVGKRDGFRDVRQTFVVTPGRTTRVAIRAEEPI